MASTDDLFKKTGAGTVTTLSAPGKAVGATSINVGATTNMPTTTGIVIAIRTVDSSGELVAGTYTEYSATVTSATALAIVATPVYGDYQIYAAGSTTQVFIPVSATAHNKMVDGILVEHNQDGSHMFASGIGVLGYAERTTAFTSATTPADVDVTSLTVTVTVPAGGRRVKITVFAPSFFTSGAGVSTDLGIKETTVLAYVTYDQHTANYGIPAYVQSVTVPTAGSHTYKAIIRQNGAGTMQLSAAATAPAFILVEYLGGV